MSDITWTTERRKIRDLIPWPRNPRQIKGEQVKRLQESVEEFGQFETIAIGPANEVYNGHQRLKSWGAKFGPDYEVEVRVSSRPLTEKEREKLTILAHKGAAGEWDFDTLANEFELSELVEWGFSEKELLGVFPDEPTGEDPGAQVDKAEELREKWDVEPGQLWQLGEHRLICGDCTDRAVVDRVMGGERAEFCFTDPPYGVKYTGGTKKWPGLKNDEDPEIYHVALPVIFSVLESDKVSLYLCAPDKQLRDVLDAVEDNGFEVRNLIIWNKNHAQFGALGAHYKSKHEDVLYCAKVGKSVYWGGENNEVSVWDIDRSNKNEFHPTEKPPELYERAIGNSAPNECIVFEPFSGSGTAIIACERLSRKCRAVEISPAYVAVALQRWADMTGKTPVLVSDANI